MKERLTGAIVLIVFAVIFIPMILDNSAENDVRITNTNIPPAPDIEFRPAVAPVEELPPVGQPSMPVEPLPTGEEPASDAIPTPDIPETAVEPPADNGSTPVPSATPPVAQETVAAETAPEKPPEQTAPEETAGRNLSAWVIQLGSFSSQQNAEGLVRRLQANDFAGYIEPVKSGAQTVFKVRVGPELSRAEAETIQKNLKSRLNLDAIILHFP